MKRVVLLPGLIGMLVGMLLAVGLAAPSYAGVEPLPVGTDVDYQLGGDKAMPAHVGIIVRDRGSAPDEGRYNICYVNGFQTQPNEKAFWKKRWGLILKQHGKAVVDEAWGEFLLDIRTPRKRQALAAIVGRWTRGCADDGFVAVEYDNLDSFSRSHRLIKRADAIAFAKLLVRKAHAADLAVGQKNLAGYDGTAIGFDFVVSEQCAQYDECDSYVEDFGDQALLIEYRQQDFVEACEQYGDSLAIVLRDRALSPGGVHRWC